MDQGWNGEGLEFGQMELRCRAQRSVASRIELACGAEAESAQNSPRRGEVGVMPPPELLLEGYQNALFA